MQIGRYLLGVALCAAAFALRADDVQKATKVLVQGKTALEFLPAVKVVVDSDLDESKKLDALMALFTDEKRMKQFLCRPSKDAPNRDARKIAFEYCARKLKDPVKLFAGLMKSRLYDFKRVDYETSLCRLDYLAALRLVPELPSSSLEHILPACEKDEVYDLWALGLIVEKGSDKLAQQALSHRKSWADINRKRLFPFALSKQRHRAPVFEFLIESYLAEGHPEVIRRCILGRGLLKDGPFTVEVPAYQKVDEKAAKRYIAAVDRLRAVKEKLLVLPDREGRWSAEDMKRLESVRALMVKKAEEYEKSRK